MSSGSLPPHMAPRQTIDLCKCVAGDVKAGGAQWNSGVLCLPLPILSTNSYFHYLQNSPVKGERESTLKVRKVCTFQVSS